jgi:hypothetical protein
MSQIADVHDPTPMYRVAQDRDQLDRLRGLGWRCIGASSRGYVLEPADPNTRTHPDR